MSFEISVAILVAVTAVVCVVPGTLLALRRQSMLPDAIGHAVLPGIVIAAMVLGTIDSPWLLAGATLSGVIVVMASQKLADTGRFAGDAAVGLVFPPMFAVGVLLISVNFRSSHLSEHSVLVGDVNMMAMDHLIIGNTDFGPRHAWTLGLVGLVAAATWVVFRRPISTATFDPDFARATGMPVQRINQIVMIIVSLTVVAAFAVAGSVLVVALMIVPPATAMLFTTSVRSTIIVSVIVALIGSQLGFWLALPLGAATSPMMALVDGAVFLLAFLSYKVVARLRRMRK